MKESHRPLLYESGMVKFRKTKKMAKYFYLNSLCNQQTTVKSQNFIKIIKLKNVNKKLTAIIIKHKSAKNNQSFNFMIICQHFFLFLFIENKNPQN